MTRLATLSAALLSCALVLTTPALATAGADDPTNRPAPGTAVPLPSSAVKHSSDGVVGRIAPPRRPGSTVRRTTAGWQVAPGVNFRRWSQTDSRGPISASLRSVKWAQAGLRIDYANAGRVARTMKISQMVGNQRAVAGINGDFFDIGRTGAPLGMGKDRRRGLLNGPRNGWNNSFYIADNGMPTIGALPMRLTVQHRQPITVTGLNSPSVRPGSIGAYTGAWGPMTGHEVTAGRRKNVRVVLIQGNKVVSNTTRLPKRRTFRGTMLIGRGAGAVRLSKLRRGSSAVVQRTQVPTTRMAISGNRFLVMKGRVERDLDDREMHPRTAIGIDLDTREVLMLVVDGRQKASRGHTMRELAEMMVDLGADTALNLDGGGSSTMVGNDTAGALGVLNSPSGGIQRDVANGVIIRYTPPAG